MAHSPRKRWGQFWHGSTRKPHQFQKADDEFWFAARPPLSGNGEARWSIRPIVMHGPRSIWIGRILLTDGKPDDLATPYVPRNYRVRWVACGFKKHTVMHDMAPLYDRGQLRRR